MNKLIYSGNVFVELQGEAALNLLTHEQVSAKYEIMGFEQMHIYLIDNRTESISSLEKFLETGDISSFHSKFNDLAWVEIHQSHDGEIHVELKEPTQSDTNYFLWIAIGISKEIPAHDYKILESTPMSKDQFALFALYQYPPHFLEPTPHPIHSYADIE